jgi:hypothetical protein
MILPFVLVYISVTFYFFSKPYKFSALFFILIGCLTYFGGAIIGAFLFSIIENGNVYLIDFITTLIGVPSGLLACLLIKFTLKSKLTKKKVDFGSDILDN